MKSVGEVMAIGRTFAESLQKALRGAGDRASPGFDDIALRGPRAGRRQERRSAPRSAQPTPDRLLKVAQAMRLGVDHEQIHASCRIDPWFLRASRRSSTRRRASQAHGLPQSAEQLRALKALGFSDARLAKLAGPTEAEVRTQRAALGVRPVFKRIDTCAAEFAAPTAYMYSTYERGARPAARLTRAAPVGRARRSIILGGGPNRIGQGIEFDYCCCHACFALAEAGIETIMVNCNPETVSTDYDTSDRLYFEPLTAEDVLEIIRVEQSKGTLQGVIVQFGGQTPLKLASALEEAGVRSSAPRPTPSTWPRTASASRRCSSSSGCKQPESGIARYARRGPRGRRQASATRW